MYLNMRLWQYYPIEMLLNKDGHGPCNVEEAHGLVYEVWDRAYNSHSTHKKLSDAINAAIDLNLMNDPDFLRPTIQYPLELIEGAFGVNTSPVVTREDEKAMSIDNIAATYAASSDSVKKTLLALTKYATVAKSVLDAETARVEVELANACLERDHYSKSLADEINLGNKLGRDLDTAKKEIEALNSRLDAVTKERDDLKMGKDLEAELTMEFGDLPATAEPREDQHLGLNFDELAKIAISHHGLTREQVFEAADSLYQKGIITYPRTESRHLTSEMLTYANLRDRLSAIYLIPGTRGHVDRLNLSCLSNVWVHDGKDHHAIIPAATIKESELTKLSTAELDVLYVVQTSFLGLFKPENAGKGFVGMGDKVRETTRENEQLKQKLENQNNEIERLTTAEENAYNANVSLDGEYRKLRDEVEELRDLRDQYQASLNAASEASEITGDNPYDVDLGDMESQITASMQEEFLTGAQLALSPQLTKARCQYLISLLNDIQLKPAAAQYDSVRQTVGAITTRYIKFCGEDFNEGFDEKLAARDQTLAGIEADTFALKEIVDNLTAIGTDAEQPSNADIEADIADFIFKRLGNYSLGGLPAHLREHWTSIKKRIEQ